MKDNSSRPPRPDENRNKSIPSSDYGDRYSGRTVRTKEYNIDPYIKPPSKGKKTAGKLFRILLTLLLIVLLLFTGYIALIVFRVNYTGEHADHSLAISNNGELKSDSSVENIMIYGADNHKEGEYGRSDSMILLSIDKRTHAIKQTSFLRDLYVTIPGHDPDRLNAAFAIGGAKLATETIEYNFGIRIDSYIVIDFSGFTSLIDAMGGITLELTEEEIDYINWQCWRNKQVETRNEIVIPESEFYTNKNEEKAAKVKLNGRQALWYARDRDSAGSDFDRTARQRILIDTMISQLKSSNPFTLMYVAFMAAPLITTDMSKTDVLGKLFSVFELLKYDKKEYRVPRSDNFSFEWVNDASVIGIDDIEYEKSKLFEFIYG